MNYLTHEMALLQSLAQSLDAAIAQDNANASQQDQAAAAARTRATQARADAAHFNSQVSAFQSQAAADDAQASTLAGQLTDLKKHEPPKTIIEDINGGPRGTPRKPVPNPDWKEWKAQVDQLTAQLNQVRAAATAARNSANQSAAAAAQAQATASTADQDAATSTANANTWRQKAAQASTDKGGVTRQISVISRWQQETARQPMDRNASETVAAEIAAQLADLENQFNTALDQARETEQRQWYLQALTQELTAKISDLNSQLAAAAKEVADATAALTDNDTRLQHVLRRQPE